MLTTAGVFGQAWVLHSTDEAIHTSAIAAKTAADAATKAADAATNAVNTNIAGERARLFVVGMTINRANEKDRNPTIVYQIANLGRTSALVTGVSVECDVVDSLSLPGGGTPTYNKERFHEAMSFITAGGNTLPGPICGFERPIIDDEFVGLSKSTKAILFKGFIDFQDVFGEKFTQRFAYYGFGDKVNAFYPLSGVDAYSAEIKD